MNKKTIVEKSAKTIVLIFASVAIFVVGTITLFLIYKGLLSFKQIALGDLLFGKIWRPTASEPLYGIYYIILASLFSTGMAVILSIPLSLLTAVFLTEMANKKLATIVSGAIELLAAIPSVIYGLLGMLILNPLLFEVEKIVFAGSKSHQFTGGANLLAAIIVLTIMILPTVINISVTSFKAVPLSLRAASLALGATREQTIFRVVIPAAKSGVLTAIVLGVGRGLGEAMAINMVAGGVVNMPLPFNSVRTLTTQIVSEMGYASGLHRQVLFTVALVLYLFIMLVNFLLLKVSKRGIKE